MEMETLIVDSGSTKADWAYLSEKGNVVYLKTQGLNPYFHTPQKIFEILSEEEFCKTVPCQNIKQVFFYGAGCSDEQFCQTMRDGLAMVFPNAKLAVEHDLLGAARATCGRSPGIAGILGTGSNSCLYDGSKVTDNITALAHVLGDDGGGVHFGKLLLQAYFYRELPNDLNAEFENAYPEGKRAIIHRIYGENQNVHIAHFAQFVIERKNHPAMQKIINEAFTVFTTRHLMKYEGHKTIQISFVGSIADSLKAELETVLKHHQLNLVRIIRRPIESLVQFHS